MGFFSYYAKTYISFMFDILDAARSILDLDISIDCKTKSDKFIPQSDCK